MTINMKIKVFSQTTLHIKLRRYNDITIISQSLPISLICICTITHHIHQTYTIIMSDILVFISNTIMQGLLKVGMEDLSQRIPPCT